MRWYEKLYVGERAKKHRFSMIQSIRDGQAFGEYILTPASNEKNILDLYPAYALRQPYYKEQDLLILGIAADYLDAAELAGRIISRMYRKTGAFDLRAFLRDECPETDAPDRGKE